MSVYSISVIVGLQHSVVAVLSAFLCRVCCHHDLLVCITFVLVTNMFTIHVLHLSGEEEENLTFVLSPPLPTIHMATLDQRVT